MNDYEAKQEARRARLEARADKARDEASRRYEASRAAIEHIPFGQPILIGHHSEKKHRAALRRSDNNMRASIEADAKAKHYERAADGVGKAGISSDDPDAPAKIRERIAELENVHAARVADNRQARREGKEAPWPAWELSNRSGNIRRLKERLKTLERNAMRETKESEFNGVRIVENAEANRLQLFFPSKPGAEIRTRLKSFGFRWSPSEGAWQRHLSHSAKWAAEHVLGVQT